MAITDELHVRSLCSNATLLLTPFNQNFAPFSGKEIVTLILKFKKLFGNC